MFIWCLLHPFLAYLLTAAWPVIGPLGVMVLIVYYGAIGLLAYIGAVVVCVEIREWMRTRNPYEKKRRRWKYWESKQESYWQQ